MPVKGFGSFDPANYHTTNVNNDNTRNGPSNQTSDRGQAAPASSNTVVRTASAAVERFRAIATVIGDPQTAIRRYLVSNQLRTRLSTPETPVRSIEDARSRLQLPSQADNEEIAEMVELFIQAEQHNLIDTETLRLLSQAAMEIVQAQPNVQHQPLQQDNDFNMEPVMQIAAELGAAGALEALQQRMANLQGPQQLPVNVEIALLQNNPEVVHGARQQAQAALNAGLRPDELARIIQGGERRPGALDQLVQGMHAIGPQGLQELAAQGIAPGDVVQIIRGQAGQRIDRAPLTAMGFTREQLDSIEGHHGARETFAALEEHTPQLLMQGQTLEDITQLASRDGGARFVQEAVHER